MLNKNEKSRLVSELLDYAISVGDPGAISWYLESMLDHGDIDDAEVTDIAQLAYERLENEELFYLQ